ADTLEIASNAVITAKGGDAGAISTVHYLNSSGANGSIGYLTMVASTYQISPHATIEYVDVKPAGFTTAWAVASTNQYQLQYTRSLLPIDWHNMGLSRIPADGEVEMSFTDNTIAGETNRFYRLISTPVE
ncbi:MAG: hypothetical protein DRP64_09745, partial [Verrucomicrobia bacterium]